jgi:hypothetical protein
MRLIASLRALGCAPSRLRAGVGCAVVLACLALPSSGAAATAGGQTRPPSTTAKPGLAATLVGCVTAVNQAERSATFSGEMTAITGSAHMQMRIDVLERLPQEASFHMVAAPGLGIWRGSAPGVRVYKYLKQVTNLSAPAFYRGAVRFRWLNAKGRLMRSEELRTPRCQQPAPPATPSPTTAAVGTAPPPSATAAPASG